MVEVRNNCSYTLWAAAMPGGGKRLDPGESWRISVVPSGTSQARIWARTNCVFDVYDRGWCLTGNCDGLLNCESYGQGAHTMAEYAIGQYANEDFMDVSVVNGFNVPMELSSSSKQCERAIKCAGDILGQCPEKLRVLDGCNGACPVFKTEEYCCNSGNCGPTNYSRFFKERCPDAYSYPKDDPTSLFTCPTGTNYTVIFCP